MKKIRILAALAAVVLAACQAQEGVPQAAVVPGLPPTAIPDVVVVQTDSTNNPINALANDIDLSGTGLTITGVTVDQTLPPLGVATATTNGTTVTFTPPAGFTGVVTLLYDIMDGDGGTSSGAIAVSVLPVALPPVAVPDAAVITQDSGANDIDVLLNDVDLSGGGLTLTSVSIAQSLPAGPIHTVAIAANQVRFTPAAAFVGVVVVNYVATDANGETANGVLTVVVSPLAVPTGPVPPPDVATVAQNSAAANHNVLANDVDPAGGGLTVTAVSVTSSLPSFAHTVSINSNQVRFTPAANFAGVVLISYTATDVNGDSANGVLTVVVSPLALAVGPVPLPDIAVVPQDSAAANHNVLANDISVAGGLTVTGVSQASSLPNVPHTISINSNQVRFTPAAGFAGVVVINYTATDANGSAPGVLTVVVTPAGLAVGPVPVPDLVTVAQDSAAANHDVLANDINPAGGALTVSAPSVVSSLPNAVHTVSINSNQVRFTPAANFAGVVVVSYTATDVNGNSAPGVLTVVVTPAGLVLGPVPVPDAATVAQDSAAANHDVLANDVDPAGGGLTVTNVMQTSSLPNVAHTLSINSNQVRFTPAPGFAGTVVVTYEATDVNGNSANGVLNIVVTPLTPPVGPLAIPDASVIPQDSAPTDVDVVANDVDFAAGGLTVTGAVVTSSLPTGTHTVSVVANQVRFTPQAGFAGIVVVTYTAEDANGDTSNGQLVVTVTPTPIVVGPLAIPDVNVASSSAGAQLFDVLANDVDPAAGGLTLTNIVSLVGTPALNAGTAAIVGNQVEYTPVLTYIGIVVITYEAEDINGNTTSSTLSLTVTP